MQASRNGDEWQEWRRMETNESSHNIISEARILLIQLYYERPRDMWELTLEDRTWQ